MNLVSNINLNYADGITSTSTSSGIIEGSIKRSEKNHTTGEISVLFQYKVGDVVIRTGWFVRGEADIQALYDAVSATLPPIADGYNAWNEALYYEAMRVEMAAYYGCTVANIDIVA